MNRQASNAKIAPCAIYFVVRVCAYETDKETLMVKWWAEKGEGLEGGPTGDCAKSQHGE